MTLKEKLFPAQEESERILIVLRRHWFTYMTFWIVSALMLLPLLAILIYWNINTAAVSDSVGNLIIVFGSIWLLFILGLLIFGFTDFYLDVYIITDRRIVDIAQNGFFKREISELNLRQIQDVSAQVDGVFATLLHYGNVNIQTAGEREIFSFESIPHPYEISKQILDIHEKYIKGEAEEQKFSSNGDDENDIRADFSAKEKEQHKKLLEGINRTQAERKNNDEGELKEGEKINLN